MCGCPVKQILIHKLCIKTFYWEPCSLAPSPHAFATLLTDREWEAVERHEEEAGEKQTGTVGKKQAFGAFFLDKGQS